LRAKTKPSEADAEGFGGSKVEADKEEWLGSSLQGFVFRREARGTGPISPVSLPLVTRRYPISIAPRF
jgi:hypothetical protein